jgi:hypothetical protein
MSLGKVSNLSRIINIAHDHLTNNFAKIKRSIDLNLFFLYDVIFITRSNVHVQIHMTSDKNQRLIFLLRMEVCVHGVLGGSVGTSVSVPKLTGINVSCRCN